MVIETFFDFFRPRCTVNRSRERDVSSRVGRLAAAAQPRVVKEIPDDKNECEGCEGRVQAYCSPKQDEHAAKTRAAQCKTDHRRIVKALVKAPRARVTGGRQRAPYAGRLGPGMHDMA